MQVGEHDLAGLAFTRGSLDAVLGHDDLDDQVLHRQVEPVVSLALRADQHHLAAAVGVVHAGAERGLEIVPVARQEPLGAADDRDVAASARWPVATM